MNRGLLLMMLLLYQGCNSMVLFLSTTKTSNGLIKNKSSHLSMNRNCDIIVPDLPKMKSKQPQHKNIVAKSEQHESWLPQLPCIPTLDQSGLLPPSMYYYASNKEKYGLDNDQAASLLKPTCRIQIAWDVALPEVPTFASSSSESGQQHQRLVDITKDDMNMIVSNLQHTIDHGMTSFQLKSYSSGTTYSRTTKQFQYDIYNAFIKDTPNSVYEQQVQLTIPLQLHDVLIFPPSSLLDTPTVTKKSIRTFVTSALLQLGTSCLDSVQIQFPSDTSKHNSNQNSLERTNKRNLMKNSDLYPDHRYYLDIIYELQELVREGHIRSISTKDMSCSMYEQIQNAQLHTLLSTNQLDINLCHNNYNNNDISNNNLVSHSSMSSHTIASNPLAGGWLTDRYFDNQFGVKYRPTQQQYFPQPEWDKLSQNEKWNWERNIVQAWYSSNAGGHDSISSNSYTEGKIWKQYQTNLLQPLHTIAQKHGVSMASILLRWMMQSDDNSNMSMSISSTVVSCRLLPEHMYWDTHRRHVPVTERVQQLREVVTFTLDQDDMDQLWEISRCNHNTKIDTWNNKNFDLYNNNDDDGLEHTLTGLYIPKR